MITITAAGDFSGANLMVKRLDARPSDVDEPTETVYLYLSIASTAPEGSIESLAITFKVELAWLTEHGIDKENMVLMRYHNSEWQQLETTMLSEDATYVYYKASATGMSTFAIAVIETVAPSGGEIPVLFIAIIIIVLAIIALVALLYYRGII